MTIPGDWDFNLLEDFIQTRSDLVIWEKAIASPERNEDHYASQLLIEERRGNRPDFNELRDGGTGWRYRDAQYVRGLVTGIEAGRNKQLLEMGYAIPGDCVFSPSMDIGPIGDFDKITFTVPTTVDEGQVIIRNAANMDTNATLSHDILPAEDRLWYMPAAPIWCEDVNGVVYTYGVDYTFDVRKKRIVWGSGRAPLAGTSYTAKYTAYLEWIAYSTPFHRYDQGRSLGQRVLLRKHHVHNVRNFLDTPSKRHEEEVQFTTRTTV